MGELKGQLTIRGVLIGCCGCAVITAASAYVALRMGALPWPIVFAAIVSLFFLKAVSKNTSTLNEANVTHTIMSAGAMVAGGLAFTIPGAWMLGLADDISLVQMLSVAFGGTIIGLISTALLRRHFVEDAELEFPIGQAAAQTLIAGEKGGKTGLKLFGAMGLSGIFAFMRDGLGVIPSMVASVPIPGITFGVYASPLMLSVGFLVGTGAVVVWFLGALIGSFAIIYGGTTLGILDVSAAQGITASLGMGVMMGSGFAIILKDIAPKAVARIRAMGCKDGITAREADAPSSPDRSNGQTVPCSKDGKAVLLVLLGVAVSLLAALLAGLSPLVALAVVFLGFVTCAMSAQSVGQTGIDPMEIFGLIVLLLVAAFASADQARLFLIAAFVAVACGLAGDVMNDFKAGHVLGTSARAQIIGQAIGGFIGALVAVAVMYVLLSAYGPQAFGPQGEFVAAQASVVATMVSGVPNTAAFTSGLTIGFVLYLMRFPSMMLGLGIYLPFYLSLTAFLGALVKIAFDAISKRTNMRQGLTSHEAAQKEAATQETGLIVASGLLGGESIVGIALALVVACGGLLS